MNTGTGQNNGGPEAHQPHTAEGNNLSFKMPPCILVLSMACLCCRLNRAATMSINCQGCSCPCSWLPGWLQIPARLARQWTIMSIVVAAKLPMGAGHGRCFQGARDTTLLWHDSCSVQQPSTADWCSCSVACVQGWMQGPATGSICCGAASWPPLQTHL